MVLNSIHGAVGQRRLDFPVASDVNLFGAPRWGTSGSAGVRKSESAPLSPVVAAASEEGSALSVHTWNPESGTWFPQSRDFGEGERSITIWNGSANEGNPGLPLELGGMIEPGADLTILNYGHFGAPDFVASFLDELLGSLDAGGEDAAAVVLTAQNPALAPWSGYADTDRDAMCAAAEERELPVIDVFAAFEEAGDWESMLTDQINPNIEGQQLWADTVTEFFAAWAPPPSARPLP